MADDQFRWCDLCGYTVTKREVEELCPYWGCPMPENPITDVVRRVDEQLKEG